MLCDFTWTEKYEEAMSDEHLLCNHGLGKKNRNISKAFLFVFHHSNFYDEASDYTFYKQTIC